MGRSNSRNKTAPPEENGLTFDAGGLIAVERSDRGVFLLMLRAWTAGARLTVPATALAQVMRNPTRQVLLRRLVRQTTTDVVPLDAGDATNVGIVLAASRTTDITDAHVVICAKRAGQPIVTSDPDDLSSLDPDAHLFVV